MDRHQLVASIFGRPRALIGVIHLPALPGTPASRLDVAAIAEAAVADARSYREAGFDGLVLENMHDRPYLRRSVGPEVVAAMAAAGLEVRRAVDLPMGVQILAGANEAAIAVAHACGAAFVRVEGFVFAHVADEGWIESDAGGLLRYRRAIGAAQVRVFADVKKKHAAHAVTADVDEVETAKAAELFLADGLVVTGISTGEPTDPASVRGVSSAVGIPTFVGSGVTLENVADYSAADGLIVGSSIKRDGVWSSPIDPSRAAALARAFRGLAVTTGGASVQTVSTGGAER